MSSGAGLRLTLNVTRGVVYADERAIGALDFGGTAADIELDPGAHHMKVVWDGYQPLEFDVVIREYEKTRRQLRMKRENKAE